MLRVDLLRVRDVLHPLLTVARRPDEVAAEVRVVERAGDAVGRHGHSSAEHLGLELERASGVRLGAHSERIAVLDHHRSVDPGERAREDLRSTVDTEVDGRSADVVDDELLPHRLLDTEDALRLVVARAHVVLQPEEGHAVGRVLSLGVVDEPDVPAVASVGVRWVVVGTIVGEDDSGDGDDAEHHQKNEQRRESAAHEDLQLAVG